MILPGPKISPSASLLFARDFLAASPLSGRPPNSRKVTLSYSAVSMTWFPVKVAVEKGFFRSEGLEPQLIQMNGNVATVALANGHIDFSLNISPVLNGAMQGLGTKLVAASQFASRCSLWSCARRSQSAAELER